MIAFYELKYSYLLSFYDNLEKWIKMKLRNLAKKKEKEKVYNTKSELYNKRFENYYGQYDELSDTEIDKLNQKFKLINLKLKDYDYDGWSTEEELDNKRLEGDEEGLNYLPPQEDVEEEVKEEKGMKILTSNKLSTRLPILLAQIKAGNNSYKLKNVLRQISYLLYQHNRTTKNIYNNLMECILQITNS